MEQATNMIIGNIIPTEEQYRSVRDAALKECDFIVISCVEKGTSIPQEWLDYRQALRTLPQQSGFPNDVVWPTKP